MPISVKRLSDGAIHTLPDFDPKRHVKSVKSHIKEHFLPKFPNGCRLIYGGKVMKSRHTLQHYGVMDADTIEMNDTKNWSSSSSSSSSTD